jgi:hypothetical protein
LGLIISPRSARAFLPATGEAQPTG